MFKNLFKDKSNMATDHNEKEELVEETTTQNELGIESASELSVEQKLEEDLANEKINI